MATATALPAWDIVGEIQEPTTDGESCAIAPQLSANFQEANVKQAAAGRVDWVEVVIEQQAAAVIEVYQYHPPDQSHTTQLLLVEQQVT